MANKIPIKSTKNDKSKNKSSDQNIKNDEKVKRGRPKSKISNEPEVVVKKRGRKTKDEFAELTGRVYEIVIEHGKEGILQSELWKKLDLTSREGSRLAIKLEKRRIVERIKLLEGGRWTYKLIPVKFPIKTTSIEHIPCITCPDEERCSGDETLPGVVTPFDCLLIENWALKEHMKLMEDKKSIELSK